MNGVTQPYHENVQAEAIKTVQRVSLAEGITGAAAVGLSIIGLVNIAQGWMMPIATLALGCSLLFEGGSVAARFTDLMTVTARRRYDVSELGSGMTAEVIGGLGGIILGILALLRIHPMILVPSAVVLFGVTLLFGGSVIARLNAVEISKSQENETFRQVAREAVYASASVQLLFGIAAITLGILALVGVNPAVLSLVGLLGVGFSGLLNGTAIRTRMLGFVQPGQRS